MVKIPTRQDRVITQASPIATGEGNIISSAIGLAQTGIQFGQAIKQKNDQTKSNEQASKLQIDIYDKWDAFKKENRGDPDLSKNFDKILDQENTRIQNDKSLNNTVKGSLSSFLTKQKTSFKRTTLKEQETQQIEQVALNTEETALTNNVLSYKMGRNKDLDSLNSLDGIVNRNIEIAEGVVSPKVLAEMKETQTKGIYSNYIKGVASTDTDLAMKILNDDELLNKMTIEEIDSLKGYVGEIVKQKETNAKNALKIIKTPEEAAQDVEIQTGIESDFLRFNIGKVTKDGKSTSGVIKNEELNNTESLTLFRNKVKEANATQSLTKEQYQKYMSDTNNAMMTIFAENGDAGEGFKGLFYDSTVQEHLMAYVNEKSNPVDSELAKVLNTSDFVGVYEKTIKDLEEEGVDITKDDADLKEKMRESFNKNLEQATRIRKDASGANALLTSGVVVPLDSEASNTTGVKLDNGGVQIGIIESGGKKYEVEVDSNGNVLRTIREVK